MKKLLSALLGIFGLFIVPAYAALPTGYTELQYIESTGTQYIDTGVFGTDKTSVHTKYIATETSDTSGFGVIGYQRGFKVSPSFQRVLWTNTNNNQFRYGNTLTDTLQKVNINEVIEDTFGNGSWIYNGENIPLETTNSFTTSPDTMVLFALKTQNDIGSFAKIKLYFCSIKENGTLVRNFIPARRNSDNVLGMYDTVGNRFYTNSGTGEFIAGPVACRNLFDGVWQSGIYSTTTGVYSSAENRVSNKNMIAVQPDTKYVASGDGVNAIRWLFYDSNKAFIRAVSGNQTITTPNGTKYINFYIAADYTVETAPRFQIEQGDTATEYVPYNPLCATCNGTVVNYVSATGTGVQDGTPTPDNPIYPTFYTQGNMVLRAVGNYKDSYDATTGKITRRVGVKVLDGTEDWVVSSSYLSGMYNLVIDGLYAVGQEGNVSSPYSSHFGHTTSWISAGARTKKVMSYRSGNSSVIGLGYDESADNLEGFKSWLAAQKAAGTPVTVYYPLTTTVEEDWTESSYCYSPIKIATTKYNETKFSPLNTALANAISVVDTVVSNTITQAASIATLQAQKQTRPADDTCPAYKQCLLVEDENGKPHWYEITDPFRDFVAPIIANNVAPASTTNSAGYTQLEYIESTGTQWIDTGVTGPARWVGRGQATANTTRSQVLLMGNTSGAAGSFVASISSQNKWTLWRNPDTDYPITSAQTFDVTWTSTNVSGTIGSINISHDFESSSTLSGTWKICSNNSSYPFAGKLYYFKAYQNNTLVRDFVPVRNNATGKYGLYDTVGQRFYGNAATSGDDFTAGPVVANDADVPGATWTATWTANATTGVAAGTVYGEGLCNATEDSTVGKIATDAQMSSANWNTTGTYCWCKIDSIDIEGSDVNTTTNKWVWITSTSGCLSNCSYYCANSTKATPRFRNIMLNTAQ